MGSEQQFISAEVLFNTYTIDTTLERNNDINYLTFCQILQKVFKVDSKRKVINKQKQTVYNLQWKPQDKSSNEKVFDHLALTNLLHNLHCHVHLMPCTSVKVKIPTGWICNGNEVEKVVVFRSDMTFNVHIRGQEIDLESNYIAGTYCLTCEGIKEVLEQVNCIQLCQGITIKKHNYIPHSNIQQELLTKQGDENINHNIVRSKLCKQFAILNNRQIPNCTTCQRLTIKYPENTPKPSVVDTLRNLVPTASDATLTFLASQVNNAQNKCSNQNRWDSTTINECLQLFTRSPEGYKSLRKSEVLLLPSPSLLLLYKNSIQQSPGFYENIFRGFSLTK